MDETRAEVERELNRMRNCIENARFRMEQHKEEIRALTAKNFDAARVANMAEWVRQDERDVRQYQYVEGILQGILERSKETPAVKGEPCGKGGAGDE
jgi:hypothetical protein